MARNLRSWWHRWLNRLTPASRQQPYHTRRQRPFLELLEERQLLSGVYTVSSIGDDGSAGTLRAAINAVNSGANNGIAFDITSGSQIINIGGSGTYQYQALPGISASGITINGINQANGTPVELYGDVSGYGIIDGLSLNGNNNTVSGLVIENCFRGIAVNGSGNIIGSTTAGDGNVLSGDDRAGIEIFGSASGTQVLGNYIGTNTAGTSALANAVYGVVDSAANTTIGGTATGAGNVISGNKSNGIVIGSSGVLVEGDYIGINAAGNGALGNSSNGIEVEANNVTIGGTAAGAGNVLSGNSGDGVKIDSPYSGVLVQGNLIGTDSTGKSAIHNNNGVEVGGSGDTIGGTGPLGNPGLAARNIISGNSNDGVLIDSSATGTLVEGNFIGTDITGNSSLANSGDGVSVAGSGNIIGGTVQGTANIIAGNGGDGVGLSASGNVVQGNYIGLTASGTSGVGNVNGVGVYASTNTIGGSSYAARNVISGNSKDGVFIASGVSGVQVMANFIGTDHSVTSAVGNSLNGIEVAGSNNTIGGTTSTTRNVISGNGNDGILIDSGVSGVLVQNDLIGTDISGNNALANSNGVEIAGSGNTIGNTVWATRNVISGNTNDGIRIDNNATGNLVQGNIAGANLGNSGFVGTSPNVGNSIGIEVAGTGNTIGGTAAGARNILSGNQRSGNSGDGLLFDASGSGNVVQGNFIGLSSAGNLLSNVNGIVDDSSGGNTIGGTVSAARNVISGNTGDGVLLAGNGSLVEGNYLGTNVAGNAAAANNNGIEINGVGNTVGGTTVAARNILAGNTADGALLDGTASGNVLQGNFVGVTLAQAALGNGGHGVSIAGSNNSIGGSVAGSGNIIANNAGGGVDVTAGSGNSIVRNSLYANGATQKGPGITLASGANNNLAAPTLNSATYNATTNVLKLSGTITAPAAGSYIVQLFSNVAGDPEGKVFIGTALVTATSAGSVSFTYSTGLSAALIASDPLITATLTDASGDSSPFSNGATTA